MSVIFTVVTEDILPQLDINKTTKETWELQWIMNIGMARVKKARIQALKWEFETLLMGEEELVAKFTGKLSRVVMQLSSLGERI